MDSHVRIFEMLGGTYKEVVYDNMRNVVTRFVGKNEKELNNDLLKLSIYCGFDINVTNCFKGNEKGHVESSVKISETRSLQSTISLKHLRKYLITYNKS